MTINPTPTERLRARTVLALAERRDRIESARRQIAALASRGVVPPQVMLGDLTVLVQRLTRDVEAANELAAVLQELEVLVAAEASA